MKKYTLAPQIFIQFSMFKIIKISQSDSSVNNFNFSLRKSLKIPNCSYIFLRGKKKAKNWGGGGDQITLMGHLWG
jgi:hypothetical protein